MEWEVWDWWRNDFENGFEDVKIWKLENPIDIGLKMKNVHILKSDKHMNEPSNFQIVKL